MISTDPFDAENKGAIYISAKRGLGIKVVEGQRIAESHLSPAHERGPGVDALRRRQFVDV